ncbi:Uncharacterized protein PBTT_07957 [Plasmodiophora brassicae]
MLMFIVCVVCSLRKFDSAMVIVEPVDSPFAGIHMRSVPFNRYLGPQPVGIDHVDVINVTADFLAVNGDCQCGGSGGIPDDVRGRIVLFTSTPLVGCSDTHSYVLLQEKGAAAWISIFPNGYDVSNPISFYYKDREQPGPVNNNMLFVAVEEPAGTGVSLNDYLISGGNYRQQTRVVISIQPDVSDWDDFYHQWYVQVPFRWIPTTIFAFAFVNSARFLYTHLQQINAEFIKHFPIPSMQTRQRRLKFTRTHLSIVHMILAIELVTTFALCAFIAIGGWQSNDILPHEMAFFFITGLSGWGFTCDVLSTVLWTNIIKETPRLGRDSWFGRFLEGHPLTKVALCVLPAVLDTGSCLATALYINIPYTWKVIPLVTTFMQLAVGVQFLVQAVRFQKHARQHAKSNGSDALDKLLQRLNVWTLCLALSMIAFVSFGPIAATTFLYTHVGWVLFWSGAGSARALTSLCRVMLAQPPPARGSAPVVPLPTTGNRSLPR